MDPATMAIIASVGAPILSNLLGGGNDSHQQVPTKSKGQQKQMNTALQQWQQLAGGGYQNAIGLLQSMLDPNSETYKNFAQPYMDQFNQQIIPGIKEQFAGMGGGMGGAFESSGFAHSLGAAGGNLVNTLAQLKEGLRMQGAQGILGQYNTMFNQQQGQEPFAYQPRSPSFGQAAMAGGSQGLANWGMNQFMNKPVGGGDQGRGYQTQPLTNTYEQLFRTGALT